MSVAVLAFYAFALVLIASALMVTLAKNPVHSVLWLILAFLNAAGLFVLMGAEFVAMLLLVVYIGAVAVLFLFVVMMLDVDFAELKAGVSKYLPLGLLIGVIILLQLSMGIGAWVTADSAASLRRAVTPDLTQIDNTRALALVMYDQYIYLFLTSSLVLLVAMIGAIVLTLRHRPNVKRQNVLQQMWRDPAATIEMKDIKPGQGL